MDTTYTTAVIPFSYAAILEAYLNCCYNVLHPAKMLMGRALFARLAENLYNPRNIPLERFMDAIVEKNDKIPEDEIWLLNEIEPNDPRLNARLIISDHYTCTANV